MSILFDKCPDCGGGGVYGLRAHPKFATCYEFSGPDGLGMGMAYFHNQAENDAFAVLMDVCLLYKQRWNPESIKILKWEEY